MKKKNAKRRPLWAFLLIFAFGNSYAYDLGNTYRSGADARHVAGHPPRLLPQLAHEGVLRLGAVRPAAPAAAGGGGVALGRGRGVDCRLAVVGACRGPHMFDITELMPKEEVICRINRAIERIKQ